MTKTDSLPHFFLSSFLPLFSGPILRERDEIERERERNPDEDFELPSSYNMHKHSFFVFEVYSNLQRCVHIHIFYSPLLQFILLSSEQ
jgi:hypothetical protein